MIVDNYISKINGNSDLKNDKHLTASWKIKNRMNHQHNYCDQ